MSSEPTKSVSPTMTTTSATPRPPAQAAPIPPTPKQDSVGVAGTANTTQTAQPAPPTRVIDPRDPWEGATAVPLSAPAIDQLKTKNPNIAIRYFNRVVATSATPHLRYEQALAMGWVPCKPEDLVSVPPGCLRDGVIQVYDVILMKMDKQKYLGDLRWRNERVNRAVQRPDVASGANTMLNEQFNREGVSRKAHGKVSAFIPGQQEINQMSK